MSEIGQVETGMERPRWQRRWIPWALIAVWVLAGVIVIGLGSRICAWSRAEYRATIASHFIVRDYLGSHTVRKLQIGAGNSQMPGWLNTDIEPIEGEAYLNATKRFPFPDRSFSYVYSEHLIEHLTREDGLGMLQECYRVLAPKGSVRVATPNLLRFVHLFDERKTDQTRRYIEEKIRLHGWPATISPEAVILNLQFRSFGHQFVYDPVTLRDTLAHAGFQNITEFLPGESDDPHLRGIEARHNSAIRDVNDYETMVMQALRP